MYIGIRVSETKVIKVYVHRLQAYQEFGDAIFDKGIEVRHLNGDSFDNSYENIAIGTPFENAMDKAKETRMRCAKKASEAIKKYSDELAQQIQLEYSKGSNYRELMKKYSISSKGTLNYILKRNISRNGAVG